MTADAALITKMVEQEQGRSKLTMAKFNEILKMEEVSKILFPWSFVPRISSGYMHD